MVKSDFVVVANRLPVDRVDGEWTTSPGGLVTALRPVLLRNNGAWVGWPGTTDRVGIEDMPSAEDTGLTLVPVNLDATDYQEFYEGFSNAALWPLYHDLIVHPRYKRAWWARYRQVNRRFADAVINTAAPSATVWVQDYQLHLVPAMVREERPDVRIGFFLHIPFSAPELFRQLPWRSEILAGTLGADLIGFHTQDSARNFLYTLRALGYDAHYGDSADAEFLRGARLPGEEAVVGTVTLGEHTARIGVFPISMDSRSVAAMAQSPENIAAANQLRSQLGNPKILLAGVDRLDYTKGIVQRLLAVEELLDSRKLEEYGIAAHDISMVQVATPSRERLQEYQHTRQDVERIVGRINGKHGTMGRPVINYVHANQPFNQLVALYSATDILLVTALKDGMNLVAKEYVSCHSDGTGALVLSEFTGAATQLTSAYLCNPFDKAAIASTIVKVATDKPKKKRKRMKALWKNVRHFDVNHWSSSFLHVLRDED